MPVVDFRHIHVPILHPFLQLACLADPMRRQPSAGRAHVVRHGVALTKLVERPPDRQSNRSRRIWLSMVGPAQSEAPCGCTFSGDSDRHGHQQIAARQRLQGIERELRSHRQKSGSSRRTSAFGRPAKTAWSHNCAQNQAPPVGHTPHGAPSTGPVARQRSVLWCITQPRAPIMRPRHLGAGGHQIFDHGDQRLETLRPGWPDRAASSSSGD